MKCHTCEQQISSKFKYAIAQNKCPYCGEAIMDEKLNGLLSALGDIVEQLSVDYSSSLEEWLLENLEMIPVEKARGYRQSQQNQPRPRHYQRPDEDMPEEDMGEMDIGDRMAAFASRTGVDLSKQQEYKRKLQQAQNGGGSIEAVDPQRQNIRNQIRQQYQPQQYQPQLPEYIEEEDEYAPRYPDEIDEEDMMAARMAERNARVARRLQGGHESHVPQSIQDLDKRTQQMQQRGVKIMNSGVMPVSGQTAGFTRA